MRFACAFRRETFSREPGQAVRSWRLCHATGSHLKG
nr:MAG TPA: hypothetical protein [Caudoviricetes sp.]